MSQQDAASRESRMYVRFAAMIVSALVLSCTAYYASRTQPFIDDELYDDELYIDGMIPDHSIAILTSERADLDDVRVRRLADETIQTQRVEITEMDWLLADIDKNGLAASEGESEERPVPEFDATAAGSIGEENRAAVCSPSLSGTPPRPHTGQRAAHCEDRVRG